MICSRQRYRAHFRSYADRFYVLRQAHRWLDLTEREIYLLSVYGLPEGCLPFLHFDLSLQYLRDIEIDGAIIILGTALKRASKDYIYIHQDHSVRVHDSNANDYLINSSLEQMLETIYQYSIWLESMEDLAEITARKTVTPEDTFDIYYSLRAVDRACIAPNSIWHQILHTELVLLPEQTGVV